MSEPIDLARVRHDNALRLFDEFVQAHVRSADAATLRGLERRFAERLQIQPSYWSQIKARSRQIGERLARQFEQLCRKPAGWMDHDHGNTAPANPRRPGAEGAAGATRATEALQARATDAQTPSSPQPQDDDERFIVGLVLTYYRRHPQRARSRLLDLLGEVLTPAPDPSPAGRDSPALSQSSKTSPTTRVAAPTEDDASLWLRSQSGVSPLPRKR